MGRKRVARKFPLEWKTDVIGTANSTVTNGVIDLDLTIDEIAEIHMVKSIIEYANIPDAANDFLQAAMYLSMDPDAIATPLTNANLEDLEVFYNHCFDLQQEVGGAGTATLKLSHEDVFKLPEKWPILVGTNVAQVVVGDASIAGTFITTVYFSRRAATASELNQILLKRR